MRIVHLLAPAPAGGLERVVHALAIGQQRQGHEVIAIPVADEWSNEHSFAVPLTRAKVPIEPIVVPGRAYRREQSMLGELLAKIRPDVLHSHGSHTDVVDRDVARRAGVAAVTTSHGFTRGPLRNRFYEYLDRIALRRFDAVAAVSRPLADELRNSGVPADRLHVVPNAWSQVSTPLDRASARQALGLAPGDFVAGWVGRMTHEKGLDVFIDALGRLADTPIRACAVGAGPERAPVEARAAASGIGANVRWPGLVQEAGRYFSAFDVLVLSSRTEGVPMVVLEAMASRIPLVATAVGGIPDVVSNGEALLVPSDRPDALAAAIRSVFENREAAAARSDAALARLNRDFAEQAWLSQYENVYGAAIDRARRRRSA